MRVRVRIPLLFLQGFAHAWPPKSHFPKTNVFMADCAGMCTGAAAHHDEAAMGYDQHHLGCGARGVSARGLRTRRAGDAAHALGTRARRGRGAPVWRRRKKSHHDLGVESPIPLYGMVWLWVPRVPPPGTIPGTKTSTQAQRTVSEGRGGNKRALAPVPTRRRPRHGLGSRLCSRPAGITRITRNGRTSDGRGHAHPAAVAWIPWFPHRHVSLVWAARTKRCPSGNQRTAPSTLGTPLQPRDERGKQCGE